MSFSSFFAGMTIVSSFLVNMDAHSFFVDGQVGRGFLGPAAGVEIFSTMAPQAHCFVSMAAEDALSITLFSVCQCSLCNLVRKAQPDGVESLQKTYKAFSTEGEFLQMIMK